MKTMMNRMLKAAILAACLIGMQAYAITLTPSAYVLTGNGGNPNLSNLGDLLYDANPQEGESGNAQDWYETAFGVPIDNHASATISWVGPDFIDTNAIYALIKDGNLPWYVYDISDWDGKEDIVFEGFYDGNQGKISHISIIGGEGTSVPDGGTTAVLLGLAMVALSVGQRLRRSRT